MSLRIRLIASIVLVLLISRGVGGAAACWHAARSVGTEMNALLSVGAQTFRHGIDGLADLRDPEDELARLVRTFDGDRHVRAEWRDAAGHLRVASTLSLLAQAVPGWFVALLAPSLSPIRLNAGGFGEVIAIADPRNEIGEVWTQLQDDLVAVGLSCLLSIVLVCLVVGRALRPLERLSAALGERDLEVMRLSGDGQDLAAIAAALGISYKTVANTCSQIKAKLGVTRTADLVRLAFERGAA